MSERIETLFVYGTLMRGEPGHHHMAGCGFVCEDQTVSGYGLVHVTWYPGLVPHAGGTVFGEVYEVPTSRWATLDAYEDCPEFYERTAIPLASGRHPQAYFYRRPEGLPLIASGDWRRRTP